MLDFNAKGEDSYCVHPSSFVDPGCKIGSGTKIWHFCHIMTNSIIGKNCTVGQNVVISPKVLIGNNVKIQNNVSLYTGVICEDDVFLGPSCVFTNVKNPRAFVERKTEFKITKVGKGATVGANATVICGVSIGEFAFVAAGSVVTKSVRAHELVMGCPATHAGWMSREGYLLNFDQSCRAWCEEEGCYYIKTENTVIKE